MYDPSTFLPDGEPTFFEGLKLWFQGKEAVLVNEHRCPQCELWNHEYFETDRWEVENPPAPKYGHYVEIQTCGNCGYRSRWVDSGFMGVMGCIDDVVHEHDSFYHAVEKRPRL